jgi:hypothetical protein
VPPPFARSRDTHDLPIYVILLLYFQIWQEGVALCAIPVLCCSL